MTATVKGPRPASARPRSTSLALQSPVLQLRGVGERTAENLARLGLHYVRDLLFHLPLRYQDRSCLVPIGALTVGDEVLIEAEVLLSELRYGQRRMLLVKVSDGTGMLMLRFFHFSNRQRDGLERGQWLRLFGEVRSSAGGLEIVHPEYQHITERGALALEQRLTPVYPMGEGVRQALLHKLLAQALLLIAPEADSQAGDAVDKTSVPLEWLDEAARQSLGLMAMDEALRTVHNPPGDADLALLRDGRHPAQRRLAFEELLVQQLSLRQLRQRMRAQQAPRCQGDGRLSQPLLAGLAFELTAAQRRVVAEIATDLASASPMQRLVQGDVGCGKTVVAALAVLQVVESGLQAVVMAPTELLAEQHFKAFCDWLEPLGIEVAWLSGKLKGKKREQMLEKIATGQARVAVGTHALFQEQVVFDHIGLVVIDEQHRFGVHQRLALREKGRRRGLYPHQLIMTATPIPRTLVMTAYADLDTSVIDELPPGRQPVQTISVPDSRRDEILQRVEHACHEGQQVYWVCTLIDESELLECQAATETATALAEALTGVRVGLIHGRLKPSEKEGLMLRFKAGDIDLLVATTVIEVGVDVPNASLMVIENADRLGLAQLHQLRGRVGRGHQKSSCVLMYRPPLGQRGRDRLAILRESNDGFEIARRDLELRGPGEVLGTRQTGDLQFRVADLVRDQDLIPMVNRVAAQMVAETPARVQPIIERWLGTAAQYGEV